MISGNQLIQRRIAPLDLLPLGPFNSNLFHRKSPTSRKLFHTHNQRPTYLAQRLFTPGRSEKITASAGYESARLPEAKHFCQFSSS